MPLPSLFVVGLPDLFLGLPLCKAQASDLIELASRAPFGRGEETIVDTSVRCTWQLSPSQFTIGNPDWEESIQTLLARVKADLGCTASLTVTCELYKLLLYEPGGFFKVSMLHYVVFLFYTLCNIFLCLYLCNYMSKCSALQDSVVAKVFAMAQGLKKGTSCGQKASCK